MGRFVPQGGWFRTLLIAAAALGLIASAIAGCSSDDSEGGPGPPGPVGPVGPVGDQTGIPGSGNVTSEPRDIAGFDEILFRSEGAVVITIGDTESLAVEADDDLQQFLQASVSGGVLEISTTDDTDIAPSQPPVFRIAATKITGIELAGAGTIEAASIESDRLEIRLGGVGDVTIDTVAVDDLLINLQGVGTVSLSGVADRQEGLVAGVSVYEAANLKSQTATIEGSGTGQATIWVTGELDVSASDTASVSYYGTPAVAQSVSGLAMLIPLGEK